MVYIAKFDPAQCEEALLELGMEVLQTCGMVKW
jgi:hypothetical protein